MAVEVSSLGLSCHNCNDAQKKFRGCNGNPVQPYLIDGKPADKCIAKYLPAEIRHYIRYYGYYKKGHLPLDVSRQPAKMLDIFDILESAEVENQKNKYDNL